MPRIEEVVNDIARAVHHRIALQNENNERDLNVKIPLTRLRRIMKLEVDSSTLNITKDALVDLAQAIRAFIRILSSLAWNLSVAADNRTMFQPRDLQVAVNASKRFDFLVDILDVLKQNTRTPIYTLRLPHPYPHLIPNMQHPTAPSLTAPPAMQARLRWSRRRWSTTSSTCASKACSRSSSSCSRCSGCSTASTRTAA